MRKSPWLLVAGGADGVRACPGMLPERMVHPGQQFCSWRLLEGLSGRASLITLERVWGLIALRGQGRSDDHPLPFHQLSSSWPSRVAFSPDQPGVPITPRAQVGHLVHGPSVRVCRLFHFEPTMSFANTIERLRKITCPHGLRLSLKLLKDNYHHVKRLMIIS